MAPRHPRRPAPAPARSLPARAARRRLLGARLTRLEPLEARLLLAIVEQEPNDTIAAAQALGLPVRDVTGARYDDWLNLDGAIDSAADVDFYRFTLGARSGVFFDIDAVETGLSGLDSALTIFAGVSQTVVAANDDGYDFDTGWPAPFFTVGGGSRDAALYADLPAGTYHLRVSGTGGDYRLRGLADTTYSTTVPAFSSQGGAGDTLYLDFDGHAATDDFGSYAVAPFDFNNNFAEFTPAERLAIKNVWRIVTEDYSPFAINVTTVAPGAFLDGEAGRVVVTTDLGNSVGAAGELGTSLFGSYINEAVNTAFVFQPNFSNFGGGLSGFIMAQPVELGNTAAHEFGHGLGLRHYGGANGQPIAIMDTPDTGLNRETWALGFTSTAEPPVVLQDDMAVISSPINTFGYRTDDHGNTRAAATPVPIRAGLGQASGVISDITIPDVDFFRFATSGPTIIRADVDEYVNDLDATLKLYDATGQLLAESDPPDSFDAVIALDLAPGTYYAVVGSNLDPGEAGQFQLLIESQIVPGALAGRVWRDDDNDGLVDPAEPGIEAARIRLTGLDDLGQAVEEELLTGPDGLYAFTGLRAGVYTLTEFQPLGYLDGRDRQGTPGTGVLGDDVISSIVLPTGFLGADNNFGELPPASLSGFVFVDGSNEGTFQPGENPVSGVTIRLTGSDDRGASVNRTFVTDEFGGYRFDQLRPGTYTLAETQPPQLLDGIDLQGTPGTGRTENDRFVDIRLDPGVQGANNNFGELLPASLAGRVWLEVADPGFTSGLDQPLPGVAITLTGTDDRGGSVSMSVNTASDGAYRFTGLRPGWYTIRESQPAAFVDGPDFPGSPPPASVANDLFADIALPAGVSGAGYDFTELRPATLSGFVYRDLNDDGLRGAGESGISGVSITLTGFDDRGGAVLSAVSTDSAGFYEFKNLRPGLYTLVERQPPGFIDGRDTQGLPGSGVTLDDRFANIVLAAGVDGTDNNFGELPPAFLAGRVFLDRNNDGLFNGADTGLPGVTIELTGVLAFPSGSNNPNRQLVTNNDGTYRFENLAPGTYQIREVHPGAWLDGRDSVGALGGELSDDLVRQIVVPVGGAGSGYDFAELPASLIAGFVYLDLDNDGLREPAADIPELGLAAVTLTLSGTDDRGASVLLTTTTDTAGGYNFQRLRPGTYTLRETQPPGVLDGRDTPGTPGLGSAGDDVFSNMNFTPGAEGLNYNFGELSPGGLAGFVYRDDDDDGRFEPDAKEVGLANVEIRLAGTDDRGAAINRTVFTSATGAYDFGTLRPGTYSLTQVQPAGFRDGRDTAGDQNSGAAGADQISGIQLGVGINGRGNNFGERYRETRTLAAYGADAGGGPHVRLVDIKTGLDVFSFFAYDSAFTGGVRVAAGDVNGDGFLDLVTAPGPGGGPHIRVFDGRDGQPLDSGFFAYSPAFTGGVWVATGDTDGDGAAEIITGADAGGGPHLRLFDARTRTEVSGLFAAAATFTGGIRVASADVNADGRADVIAAAGPGDNFVTIYSGRSATVLNRFNAFPTSNKSGVFVTAGDVSGDARPEIIAAPGAGGTPTVRIFDSANGRQLATYSAFDAAFRGGVRLATADVNADGRADVIAAAGPGLSSRVVAFSAATSTPLANWTPYGAFSGGLFVSAFTPAASTTLALKSATTASSTSTAPAASSDAWLAAAAALWNDAARASDDLVSAVAEGKPKSSRGLRL